MCLSCGCGRRRRRCRKGAAVVLVVVGIVVVDDDDDDSNHNDYGTQLRTTTIDSDKDHKQHYWLVVWNIFYFSIYWE